jgi:protein-tyrosine phosphatase
MSTDQINVLFVCMGNICRSPTAHGVFANLVAQANLQHVITVDSAGTHAYHIGEAPDQRSQQTASIRGIDLSNLKARKVLVHDFAEFDYILVMDQANLNNLRTMIPRNTKARVQLFMDYAQRWQEREIPDPYYGGTQGFERVLDMVEDAAEGLLLHLRQQYQL